MSALIASAVLTSAAVTDTTLNVPYPGALSSMLTHEERQTITSLTLTGEIDASDFQFMRDSLPVLASLDLSQVTVTGNEIPNEAFCSYNKDKGDYDGKKALTSVRIPPSIKSIGERAFRGCNIISLDLSNCTSLEIIGIQAFKENKQLTEIKLPESISEIGGAAFNGCALTSLDLSNCTNLKTVTGFGSNSNLSEIKLPASVTEIIGEAFLGCGLKSLDLSNCTNLKAIGSYAFTENLQLSRIKLPESITEIGAEAFLGCALTSLDLSNCTNLKTIGSFAFYDISYILSVLALPASIEYIGNTAFSWRNVSLCKLNAAIPPEMDDDNISPDMILLVPEGSASAYKEHPIWGECQIIAGTQEAEVTVSAPGRLAIDIMETTGMSPAEITHLTVHGEINETDFGVMRSNMTKLMYLDMSDVIPVIDRHIGDTFIYDTTETLCDTVLTDTLMEIEGVLYDTTVYQYINCTYVIDSVYVSDTVIITPTYEIPAEAFNGKKSLLSLRLPKTLQSIGIGAFRDCTSLSDSITMPKGMKRIADEVFSGCASLPYIGFNDSLTHIGYRAFRNCRNLNSLRLPQSLEDIGYDAFNGCSGIADTVELSPNITRLNGSVFYGCSSLRGVVLPDSLYSIGSGAFSGCESLGNFQIPRTLTEIGSSAFDGCTSITSISLPAGLHSIGASAFEGCRALSEISCANPVPPSLGNDVFKRVDNETCLLSIPTDSYYDYLLAQQWGAFVQMRESIDVSTDDRGGEITVMDSVFDGSAEPAPLVARAPRNDVQQSSARMGVAVYDGASVYVKKENRVTFFITPRKNYEVKQVLYNGEDVTGELRGGAYSTPAVSGRGNSFEVIYEWTGEAPVLTIDQQEMTLTEGETATLSASIMPADYPAEIEWRSSDNSVGEEGRYGRTTAHAPGEAEIIASASDGSCSDTCIVTVEKKEEPITPTLTIDRQELTLTEGDTATLSASITPADYPAEIEWRSSDNSVAEVDGNGCITAIAPGVAEIIASASDGSCADTCHVTVEKKGETAVITTEEESIEVWAAEGALTVHGVPSGERVTVYAVSGQAVATAMASGGDLVFLLPRGAVYIVVTESAKPTKVTL